MLKLLLGTPETPRSGLSAVMIMPLELVVIVEMDAGRRGYDTAEIWLQLARLSCFRSSPP